MTNVEIAQEVLEMLVMQGFPIELLEEAREEIYKKRRLKEFRKQLSDLLTEETK